MENHHVWWENSLEMAIFNSKLLNYQRVPQKRSVVSHVSPMVLLFKVNLRGPVTNVPASRQQTGVPQHLCGLHLGQGQSAGKTCYFIYFKRRTINFLSKYHHSRIFAGKNPTEAILWGVQTSLKPTEKHPDMRCFCLPHHRTAAGLLAGPRGLLHGAPAPGCWDGTCDILGVPETGDISQNGCFLWEIWWLYEWPLDFGGYPVFKQTPFVRLRLGMSSHVHRICLVERKDGTKEMFQRTCCRWVCRAKRTFPTIFINNIESVCSTTWPDME